MAGNAWLSGTDRMLEGLAQREALARQARLDQEAAARAAQQLAMQQQNLDLNRQQTEAQIANQNADNDRANAATIENQRRFDSAGKAKVRNEEQVAALVDMYQSTADPAAKQRIAMNLAMQGVKVEEPKVAGPDTRSLQLQANDALASGDTARYQQILKVIRDSGNAGRAPETGGSGGGSTFRDNPRIPQGAKAWIDSIAGRGVPLDQARNELNAGFGQQRAAHPNIELAEAAQYLSSLYPDGLPLVSQPPGAAATEADAPTSLAAVPAWLESKGAPATPENIAATAQRFGLSGRTPSAPRPSIQPMRATR